MKYLNYLLPLSLVIHQMSFAEEQTAKRKNSSSQDQPSTPNNGAPREVGAQPNIRRKPNVQRKPTEKSNAPVVKKRNVVQKPKSENQLVAAKPVEKQTLPAVEVAQSKPLSETDKEQTSAEQPVLSVVQEEKKEEIVQNENVPSTTSSSDDKYCSTPYHTMHVGIRHTEAHGVGYSTGYTTLEGFGIFDRHPGFMPFFDLRGHVFDNGKLAGNIGIGGRTWFSSIHHILGYYLYYDVRQDHHHLTPQQLSPGIELLGKRMEYRMNGYFPVGENESHKYGFGFDSFSGHRILLKYKQRHVMTGVDAEIGGHITQSAKYDVYAGAGPYYFTASGTSAWGGKVRLLGRYKQYVSLEASYSYDRLFGSIVQGSVAINMPFGKKLKYKDKQCEFKKDLAFSRAAFAPYRFEIPVVKRLRRKQNAINPATGDSWKVWFVDNTSSSSGTYRSPFSTLADAQNASQSNDMIYVFPGDGTTDGMNMGIILKDGQDLFGSGIAHHIRTTKGRMKIPAFSSKAPTITHTAGNVVKLANNNEVSGFNILASLAGSIGIDGTSGVQKADINHNSFFGNVGFEGMHIIGWGDVDVKHNHLVHSVPAAFHSGITVTVTNGQFMDANISNNHVSGFRNRDISFGPASNPSTASATAIIEKNTVTDFGFGGIIYPTGMPNSIVQILNNLVIDNAGVMMGGIGTDLGSIVASVNNAPDSGTVIIDGNTVLTPTSTSQQFGITTQINLPTGTKFNAVITNNTVYTGSGANSVGVNLFSRGDLCASVTDNQIHAQTMSNTTDLNISTVGASSNIDLDDLSGNTADDIIITGHIHLVPKGTCGD